MNKIAPFLPEILHPSWIVKTLKAVLGWPAGNCCMLGKPRAGPPSSGDTRRVDTASRETFSRRKQSREDSFRLREQHVQSQQEGRRGQVLVGRTMLLEARKIPLKKG